MCNLPQPSPPNPPHPQYSPRGGRAAEPGRQRQSVKVLPTEQLYQGIRVKSPPITQPRVVHYYNNIANHRTTKHNHRPITCKLQIKIEQTKTKQDDTRRDGTQRTARARVQEKKKKKKNGSRYRSCFFKPFFYCCKKKKTTLY